jgi:hypothetical protein
MYVLKGDQTLYTRMHIVQSPAQGLLFKLTHREDAINN